MERTFADSMAAKLFHSCVTGDLQGVRTALMQGASVHTRDEKDGCSPLLMAAENGHVEICSLLVAHGCKVDDKDSKGRTPLSVAVRMRHAAICELLLAHGAIPADSDNNNLSTAARNGDEAIMTALISAGAEVDMGCGCCPGNGRTAMSVACESGHLACVLILLKAGANITQSTGYKMPIHAAAENNRVDVVRVLLEHGCNPNMVSFNDLR